MGGCLQYGIFVKNVQKNLIIFKEKMKRTKNIKRPDLILTSDWHLREDTPICRTDDFWGAQWAKVKQVSELQKQYDCFVMHAGDLFDYWKPSPWLLSWAIDLLPKKFYTVFGNHDLPNHNMKLNHKSGIYTLVQAKTTTIFNSGDSYKGSIGQGIGDAFIFPGTEDTVGIWHKFVWDGKHWPWPECPEMTAKEVLKKYDGYDLIVTGDYHKPFTYEYKGRLLVNPGCLTRQVADYADHRPRVYLWYAETNTVEPHYLDISDGVVSREHIEKKEEIDKRIEAFISRLSDDWETVTSFDENLKRFMSSNRIRKEVKELVYKAIE